MLIEPDKYYGYLCKVHMLHRMLEKSYKNCILGGEKGTVLHCWWEYKLIQPVWKTVWRFLKKLGIKIPYDPTISILGTYPEKIITEKNTYIPVFIAALFIIARTWKQCRCPLTDEGIKKPWYLYTMEYYSAIKKNEMMRSAATWMDAKTVILSEVRQRL